MLEQLTTASCRKEDLLRIVCHYPIVTKEAKGLNCTELNISISSGSCSTSKDLWVFWCACVCVCVCVWCLGSIFVYTSTIILMAFCMNIIFQPLHLEQDPSQWRDKDLVTMICHQEEALSSTPLLVEVKKSPYLFLPSLLSFPLTSDLHMRQKSGDYDLSSRRGSFIDSSLVDLRKTPCLYTVFLSCLSCFSLLHVTLSKWSLHAILAQKIPGILVLLLRELSNWPAFPHQNRP